jgi:hypothetical protein
VIELGWRHATALAVPLFAALVGGGLRQAPAPAFDHGKHAKVFVSCTTCHAGIEQQGAAVFPPATACATCHDGEPLKRVEWQARSGPRVSNLHFDHRRHAELRRAGGDTTGGCEDCHADRGASWMQVRAPSAPQCLGCHTPGRVEHLTAPDSACATCHLPLARAAALPRERVAKFPTPPSHRVQGFLTASGHGAQARAASGRLRVAASCATCHARDFCAACHVDAPETATIQALDPDPRSLALPHELKAPASHLPRDFKSRHGSLAGNDGASCRSCHTRESCFTCHRAEAPASALALYAAGPGRGEGARTARRAPATHTPGWDERHGPAASAAMRSCAGCHARDYCLSCHKPDPARRGSYHSAGYLTRHPAEAYSRASSCTDCHNTGEFCQSCHLQAGLSAKRTLLGASGYHDGNRQFFLGHGQAARQSLESCVSCHVERDCLTCHSVVKGRGFNPHGPGFDPERMLRKNPQLCIACHGTAIPRR